MLEKTIKIMRKNAKLTQAQLAGALGITQQAVGRWENGSSAPDPKTLVKMAEIFGVSLDALLNAPSLTAGQSSANFGEGNVMIPVLGTVRAGYGALAFEEELGQESANVRDPEKYFYLIVKGDSMEPRISDGDLALVRKQQTLEDGELGVIVYGEGEGTLKRFQKKGNAVVLQPFNPSYDAIILSGEELENLYIAGKVVETKARW